MRRRIGVLGLLLAACNAPLAGRDVGSNTNWLRACESDGECGGALGCFCNTCTLACATDADCDALGPGRCAPPADPAASSACGGGAPVPTTGVCLPRCEPGTCSSEQACVEGACVPAALPANDFCAPVADWTEGDRRHEDELLSLVQSLRTTGGETCGGATPSTAVGALRLDPRLLCEARVLAVDSRWQRGTRARGLERPLDRRAPGTDGLRASVVE